MSVPVIGTRLKKSEIPAILIAMSALKWNGPGSILEVGPFRIADALVYSTTIINDREPSAVYVPKRFKYPTEEGHLKPQFGYEFFYDYKNMSANARYGYLEWLQNGRPPTKQQGYRELFLQGLERRVIEDGCDAGLIWNEVWRLCRQAPAQDHYGFLYAAGEFLWFLLMQAGDAATEEQVLVLAANMGPRYSWDDGPSQYMSLLIHWCLGRYGHLPMNMAYHCARELLRADHLMVAQRCKPELFQMFSLRFRARWGDSVPIVLPPKATNTLRYHGSNRFLRPVEMTWKDPTRARAHWGRLSVDLLEMLDECMTGLRALSLALGKEGVTRESASAWLAMPPEIRTGEHPSLGKLEALGGASLQRTGFAAMSLADVAPLFDFQQREKLTPDSCRKLAGFLDSCGYGIEPDARLTGKSCAWGDPLVLFTLKECGTQLGIAYEAERWQAHACFIRCALHVAKANGEIRQDILTIIARHLFRALRSTPHEQRRSKALVGLLVQHGGELAAIRPPDKQRAVLMETVPPMLMELIGHDGRVTGDEEMALEQVWKKLGLNKKELTRKLDELSGSGVIFLGNRVSPRAGEKIPPAPAFGPNAKDGFFELDHAAISSLLEDTQHVQRVLAEAMLFDSPDESPPHDADLSAKKQSAPETRQVDAAAKIFGTREETTVGATQDEAPAGEAAPPASAALRIDSHPRLTPFLTDLLGKPRWERTAAEELARKHNTMLSGAIETINDWAFDTYGDQLVWDDGDSFAVELALVESN